MKVYILGEEGTGWSIDKDRYYTQKAIENINAFEITNNIFKADIIYVIWWNKLLSFPFKIFNFLFKKKIIATITNDLSHQESLVKKIIDKVDLFVFANTKQKNFLLKIGVDSEKLVFNPFYVDETIFKELNVSKPDICSKLNINYNDIKGKVLVGSFQRDSLGSNLLKPKWQKNPDMVVDIMKLLDKDEYVLILAGPRRHYIIDECMKYGINYVFIGDEESVKKKNDDISLNGLPIEIMPYLYNLIDIYIVSSKSEGGPKAIPESILCNTNIISTDVGFANDLIDKKFIYVTAKEAVEKIKNINEYKNQTSNIKDYYNFESFKKRIEDIIDKVSK